MKELEYEYYTLTDIKASSIDYRISESLERGWEVVQILPNVSTDYDNNYSVATHGTPLHYSVPMTVISTTYVIVFKRNRLAKELYGD